MTRLAHAVEQYVALRRALGFRLKNVSRDLSQFAAFLERQGAPRITIPLALQWAQDTKSPSPIEWARRLRSVRGFARHWSATDPRTEIPPLALLPQRTRRARPYLYTDDEIARLLAATQRLASAHGLRCWTYHTLLSMLVVTGVRLSEALHLGVDDVDCAEGVLVIRHTKFGKSRLVPLHATTQWALADYVRRRDAILNGRPAPAFFVSDRGRALERTAVYRTFYELSRQVGLRRAGDHHGPRLHDFRHRFAVYSLLHWYRAGQDVERQLPILATYLGHVHVSDTYWYLSASPELLGLATARLERRWEGTS